MSYTINQPSNTTYLSDNPTVQEMAAKSNNRVTKPLRSLNGRKLMVDINHFRMPAFQAMKALADVFPVPVDPTNMSDPLNNPTLVVTQDYGDGGSDALPPQVQL